MFTVTCGPIIYSPRFLVILLVFMNGHGSLESCECLSSLYRCQTYFLYTNYRQGRSSDSCSLYWVILFITNHNPVPLITLKYLLRGCLFFARDHVFGFRVSVVLAFRLF